MTAQRGFTILELMIGVAIVGITASMAIPSLTSMVQRNRSVNDANGLAGIMFLSRSEAIKRNQSVIACKTADGATCDGTAADPWACRSNDTSCNASSYGTIVFVDANGNSALDAGDVVIRVEYPLSRASTITWNNGNSPQTVTYKSSGLGATAGTFVVNPGGNPKNARLVVVALTGRPRVDTCDVSPKPGACP